MKSASSVSGILTEFANLSGLVANPSKSSVFCAGVDQARKDQVLQCLRMTEAQLPVRYLGVPLISKRLSATDCNVLLERVAGRINSWMARKLSFAGRLQLVSSVLFSIQVFWSSIFILPKKIYHLLTQKFSRFLWGGSDSHPAHAKVAWVELCVPKREGGLGLKMLEDWNKASMLRHIWNLFVKSGSLWVAWINAYVLKGRSFWGVKIPQSCSWSWRKLLKLREVAKTFIRFKVGAGDNIFIWHDLWHPDGILIEKYGFRPIYDAGSHTNAKLSSFICNNQWNWPPARSDALVCIQSQLPLVPLGESDQVLWNFSKTGTYHCSETWDYIRNKRALVPWWKLIWFPLAIPKQALSYGWLFRIGLSPERG
jgi:hypothetical protein